MKPYHIERAKKLYDEWRLIGDAAPRIRIDSKISLEIKGSGGDISIPIEDSMARFILTRRETEIKLLLKNLGVDID